jgi:aspartate aminotransferase
VVVTQGGRFGIYLAMAATLSMGDEAIVIDPSWPHYKQVASMLGPLARPRLAEGQRP